MNKNLIAGKISVLVLLATLLVSYLLLFKSLNNVWAQQPLSVTICHRTDSNSNPYVTESPNIQNDGSLTGGHLDHTGPLWPAVNDDGKWGDIIPPYTHGNFSYPGMNWPQGQAIWNNECSIKGKMIVKKVMVGGTDSFTFTGDVAGTISSNNGTLTVNNVTPGTYSSVESAKSGWSLTSITCDDGQSANVSTGNTGTRTATFKVDAGETVTCTFTNTKQVGNLVVHKEFTDKHSNVEISITLTWQGDFAAGVTDENGNATFSGFSTSNIYTAHASEPQGYYESGNTCINVPIVAGQTTNCTITDSPNNQPAPTVTPTATPAPTTPSCASDEHLNLDGTKCLKWELGGAPPPPPTTPAPQVLGASTMAKTGSFAENAYLAIIALGGLLSFKGIKDLKKTFKKA